MEYALGTDPMVLLTLEAAETEGQRVLTHTLEVEDATVHRIGAECGVGQRVWASVTVPTMRLRYRAQVNVSRTALPLESLPPTPLHALPSEAVTHLRPSRYCQSDMFLSFVESRFGEFPGGAKVAAIRDWVAEEMRYVPASSNAATTVLDTFATREGVCRDFVHMVCALCRAAGIPARYASVYGAAVEPPDFHAVAEVWLDGAWRIVDATGMCSADAAVVVAVGRDACDVAFMETETPAYLVAQSVLVTEHGVTGAAAGET
ncbi:MAG: transglutaminase-like domain-containing protein [Flavimaricola sp.]|nr:transglutaminase-like domain-containing protein [Flavimaricola sp.]